MFERLKFRIRYGKILDFKSLSDEQKRLLFDPRIKNHVDRLGKKTVEIVENKVNGIDLSLVDRYSYNSHNNKKNKGDYVLERTQTYREVIGRFPEYVGSWENRYRLNDNSLVSITFDIDDLSKKLK